MYKGFLLTLIILLPILSNAQSVHAARWTIKNPFEQKAFIQNKGQYRVDGHVAAKDVLFGARQGGLQYYFTKQSIWIKHDSTLKQKPDNDDGDDDDEKDEAEEKTIEQFHEMNFAGAGDSVTLLAEEPVSWRYNFNAGSAAISAPAFKKLTYKNLYPGIDMEFYFPKDKPGFEYTFIVHPGGDISNIKIEYPLSACLQNKGQGSLKIKSAFGEFTDHAPVAYQNVKRISSSFIVSNSCEQFSVPAYDKTQTLVIDPWTTTPTFNGTRGTNAAYDVDWDDAGNCYIYGGDAPYQLIKYNNNGVMQWSYTSFINNPGSDYGGFAVDRHSQSSYVIGNLENSEVVKLNSSGMRVDTFELISTAELWRIAFSRCTNQAVIVLGRSQYHVIYLDTTLSNLTQVNILGQYTGHHDFWGVAVDNYGSCYVSNCDYQDTIGKCIYKLPLTSLLPATWKTNSHFSFQERGSMQFRGTLSGNAYNGMTVSNTLLYTYDNFILRKWNTANGLLVDSAILNPVTNQTNISLQWGGLTSDDCLNIFLGSKTNIIQFDGNTLKPVDTIGTAGTIYAVSLGNDIVYAAGNGFVSAFSIIPQPCHTNSFSPYPSHFSVDCSTLKASAFITSLAPVPHTVAWNTIPVQTGDTAKNLSTGTYIATIITTPFACAADTVYDTIKITSADYKFRISVNSPTFCIGNPVALNATGAQNYTWAPATKLNATTGSSVLANPASTTTYTVIGSGNGCIADTVFSIATPTTVAPVLAGPLFQTICPGQVDTLYASGLVSYSWYPTTSLNTSTGAKVVASPTFNTVYVVTGTSAGGCAGNADFEVNVAQKQKIMVFANPTTVCAGTSVTMIASGESIYSWSPATGLTATNGEVVTATPTVNTTYTIIGTDEICFSDTATVAITVGNITVTASSDSICHGDSVILTAHSTLGGAMDYIWGRPISTQGASDSVVVVKPTSSITYTLDPLSISCNGTNIQIPIFVNPAPTLTVSPTQEQCSGASSTLTAGGASRYQWAPGNSLTDSTSSTVIATPAATTVYTVTGFNGGCSISLTDSVIVLHGNAVSVNSPTICNGNTATLTATGAQLYRWQPAAALSQTTGSTVTASPSITTTYTLIAAEGTCTDTAFSVVTVVPSSINPVISAHPDTLCIGEACTLVLSGGTTQTIQWQSSANGQNFTDITGAPNSTTYRTTPLAQSTYFRALVDSGNCGASSNPLLVYITPPLTAKYTTTSNGYTFYFNPDSSQGKIVNYHWDFGDGSFTNDSTPAHTYTNDTTYYACLTIYDNTNCSYTYCKYLTINLTTGLKAVGETSGWMIYPDPFSNRLMINNAGQNVIIGSIKMFDVLGRLRPVAAPGDFHLPVTLDVSALAPGIYYIEIQTATAEFFFKVVKQ